MKVSAGHPLHVFMAQITDEMASEYERIYTRAAEDPGTAGDEGEENWASLLKEWLPSTYHVKTKGRIINHNGVMSPQADIVVLKPSYPPKLLEKRIWLAAEVAAVFECKNTLKAKDIESSVVKCAETKRLYQPCEGNPRRELHSPIVYGLLAHSHAWKSTGSKPVRNIRSSLHEALNLIDHPRLEIDLVCVADTASWVSMYIAFHNFFGGDWGAVTSSLCASEEITDQVATFRPIGVFLAALSQKLAWDDISMRDLADYYRLAGMWASGLGTQRYWPANVFSDAVRVEISKGRLKNGGGWSDWSLSGF